MNDLRLPLKKQWFEMTEKGIKPEDYREINLYWFKRLVFDSKKVIKYLSIKSDELAVAVCKDAFWSKSFGFKSFETNTMTLGYPKSNDTARILKYEHKGIEIRIGNPDWGAEPNKLYFVIKHGKII